MRRKAVIDDTPDVKYVKVPGHKGFYHVKDKRSRNAGIIEYKLIPVNTETSSNSEGFWMDKDFLDLISEEEAHGIRGFISAENLGLL